MPRDENLSDDGAGWAPVLLSTQALDCRLTMLQRLDFDAMIAVAAALDAATDTPIPHFRLIVKRRESDTAARGVGGLWSGLGPRPAYRGVP
jgi:hypothetical protein